ncbi:hypothetical protein URH17368_1644 [Alicyclobacillus hesperidum URH17-3-68]|nr:hypothetical protein URH17368_1644 [Alicyclobacillus hesperidum URH17-3-68]
MTLSRTNLAVTISQTLNTVMARGWRYKWIQNKMNNEGRWRL